MNRRDFLCALGASVLVTAVPARALQPEQANFTGVRLDLEQSRRFRAWVLRVVRAQFQQGPTPRWAQRDCAGLVRFAAAEALREHDENWRRANGLGGGQRVSLPLDLSLTPAQQQLRHRWRLADGSTSAYAGALEMIQENTVFVGKDVNLAQPADLLFFDQGDDQHLMLWMGNHIAYHTGTVAPGDNGLRAVTLRELLDWKDTRWQPTTYNSNYIGVFRFAFLAR
jgi:uncharacterized protein